MNPGPKATFRTLPGAESDEAVSLVVVTGMNYAKFHGIHRGGLNRRQQNTTTPPQRGEVDPDKQLGYPALASILKRKPDFFVGTGDNVYYDSPPDSRATTIPQMRRKWHEQFVQPRFRQLFAAVPTYWEVDDHDYRSNDCDNSGVYKPTPEDGAKVLFEQLPIGLWGDPHVKTYRTYRVNRDLQIWFTEGRLYRSTNKMPDGPDKSMWGSDQKAWLKRTLTASDTKYKLLISPTPLVGPDDRHKRDNHPNIGGFRHEGDEFFAWLAQHFEPEHLLIVCGDRHWQNHARHPSGFEEFSCGALVDANSRLGRKPGDPKSTDPQGLIQQRYTQQTRSGGFLEIQIATDQDTQSSKLTFTFHDELGKVFAPGCEIACRFEQNRCLLRPTTATMFDGVAPPLVHPATGVVDLPGAAGSAVLS